jgi:signal transduction histidine kinase
MQGRWQQSSLRTQIIVAFAVIGFLATLLNAVLVGIFLKNYITARQGSQILAQAQTLSQCCDTDTALLLHTSPGIRTSLVQATLSGSVKRYILLIDVQGKLIYASPQLSPSLLQELLARARSDLSHTSLASSKWQLVNNQIIVDVPIAASSTSSTNTPVHHSVVVGELLLTESQSVTDQVWQRFLGLVVIAAFATIFLVLLGTLYAAQTLTRPIRTMTETAHAIAQGDYKRRVSPRGPQELHALSLSFNHMVDTVMHQQQAERDLIANVSHELAAPLGLIRGYAEALIDGVIDEEARRVRVLHAISTETTRLARLSGDLLDLAMLETGQITLHLEPVPIADLLIALHDHFTIRAQQQHVSLILDLASDLPIIQTDGERVEQVLVNLINNALQHTPSGGTIRLQASARPSELLLSITDTGTGIPPDVLARIWERFYQVDEGRDRREQHTRIEGTREGAGVGLGLAVCRSIMSLLRGTIEVESTVGKGTTFTLTLPLEHIA